MVLKHKLPQSTATLQEGLRTIRHTDLLRTHMQLAVDSATAGGADAEVVQFMAEYTERLCALTDALTAQVVRDQIEAATRKIDPEKVEQEFQAHRAARAGFQDFVQGAVAHFTATGREAQLKQLVALYNKLDNTFDRIVKVSARENMFDRGRTLRDDYLNAYDPNDHFSQRPVMDAGVPGGMERLFFHHPKGSTRHFGEQNSSRYVYGDRAEDLDAYIADVMKVVYREIATAHPTELETADAVSVQNDFYEAARELVTAPADRADYFAERLRAISDKLYDPKYRLIKQDAQGHNANFTPLDEALNAHLPMTQRYHALKETYGTHFRAIDAAFGKTFTPARQEKFFLNYSVSTWVPSDVDGNHAKKSEHSLLKIITNTRSILGLYLHDLQAMDPGLPVPHHWNLRLQHAVDDLALLHDDVMIHEKSGDVILNQTEFTDTLARFTDVMESLRGQGGDFVSSFSADLRDAFKKATVSEAGGHPQARDLLMLRNMVGSFGAHFELIEYRQTSDRLAEVMDFLLQKNGEYLKTNPAKRLEMLDEMYRMQPQALADKARAFLTRHGHEELRNTQKDIKALTLHSLRMMQMAAALPGAMNRMVLAEYHGGDNYMEAVALQKAMGAQMHVMPLLEENETLQKYKSFQRDVMTTPSLIKHVYELAGHDLSKLTQYWMAAYSDNIKRSGIATRIGIDSMWRGSPDFLEQFPATFTTQVAHALKQAGIRATPEQAAKAFLHLHPVHGKSLLHADRDGQRALTANMRDYTGYFINHLGKVYFEHTTQGRDNTVKQTNVDGIKRNLARIFSEGSQLMAMNRLHLNGVRSFSPEFTAAVAAALQKTSPDYQNRYFSEASPHGAALTVPIVNDAIQKAEGNSSSRASSRGNDTGTRNIYARGENHDYTVPVKTSEMRAIGLVEDDVHMGSRLSALGLVHMEPELNKMFQENPRFAAELQRNTRNGQPAFDAEGELLPAGFTALRTLIPFFKKHADEITFAGRTSDLPGYEARLRVMAQKGVPVTKEVEQDLSNRVADYLAGEQFSLKNFGLDPAQFDREDENELSRIDRFRYLQTRFAMPLSNAELDASQLFDTFGTLCRDELCTRLWLDGDAAGDRLPTREESVMLRELANARLAFTLGNNLLVADPLYAQDLMAVQVREARKTGAQAVLLEPAP